MILKTVYIITRYGSFIRIFKVSNRFVPLLVNATRQTRCNLRLDRNSRRLFNIAEMTLTNLLAYVLRYSDTEGFSLLVRGMDARVKCERFKKACLGRRKLGPNFRQHLNRFERVSVPLRNRISHSWPMQVADEIVFCHVGTEMDPTQRVADGTEISVEDLQKEALWLCRLSSSMLDAIDMDAKQNSSIEIED